MSTRRAITALCTIAVAVAALVNTVGAGGGGASVPTRPGGPPLVLVSQTPWVTAPQPWFNIALGVSPSEGAPGDLRVSLSFYGRVNDASDLQQAISGTPSATPLLRVPDVPVTAVAGGLSAAACVTVLPDADASAPTSGTGACAPGTPGGTLTLGCMPLADECGDVYPVSVALVRQGSSSPLARFTTFLTYQQPNAVSATGGPLRVGVVVPVSVGGVPTMADALTDHHDVAATLAVNPSTVNAIQATRPRDGLHALDQLAALSGDEMIDQPYVPINVAALSEAGIAGEIGAQVDRGDDVLRSCRPQARRRPVGGHHLHLLAGRRGQPRLGPAAGRGAAGGD